MMLIIAYFVFFINYLFFFFTLELFILFVYGLFISVVLSFVSRNLGDLDVFELESKEDEATASFLFLSIIYYNLLKIRLYARTIFIVFFVDSLVTSLCEDLASESFSSELKILHDIYKLEDINSYIDDMYSIRFGSSGNSILVQ